MNRLSVALVSMLLVSIQSAIACHIPPNPPDCPQCPPGSTLVDIDFDDYFAGTLVGGDTSNSYYDGLQLYTSDSNSSIYDGLGFTIDVGDQCGNAQVGTLYDTDRRIYTDKYGNATTDYEKAVNRDDDWVARAARGEDPDLETTGFYDKPDEWSQWSGGNMKRNTLGNALIIQEHLDCNDVSEGHLDLVQGQSNASRDMFAPDDDAAGGYITFEFESAMNGFGFTFADLDWSEVCSTSVTFFDASGASTGEISFNEFQSGVFEDRGTNNTSGSVYWGDNKANRIDTLTVSELNNTMNTNLSNISTVKFHLSGSGGITHINYCHYDAVPEASTLLGSFGLLGLLGLHITRRRKKLK